MNLNTTAEHNKASSLTFSPTPITSPSEVIIIGRQSFLVGDALTSILPKDIDQGVAKVIIDGMLSSIKESGKATTYLPTSTSTIIKLTIIIPPPPAKITRNNHPFSPHFISDSLVDIGLHSSAMDAACNNGIQVNVLDGQVEEFAVCAAGAVARSLPLYHSKSSAGKNMNASAGVGVNVSFYSANGTPIPTDSPLYATTTALANGVRLAAKLGDSPPAELNPNSYAAVCKSIATELASDGANVTYQEIVGDDLRKSGYGGIYGVGMAAQHPPRLVVLTYVPEGGEYMEHIALCGKGVIYDTGGLAIKPKVGMCGMKHDMGGSAGVLSGFQAAVQLKLPRKITLILPIVENAVGPDSFRNDDILTMKSGKTVEINNTDAEGRLILGDAVSHASNSIGKVDTILDMATLTGAVCITTGTKHAGILAKTEAMEKRIFAAGMNSGDLVYPMIYAPELLKSEFASEIADMKNSVKNRGNAQASCAGHFIESHIDEAYEGDWVHVDMAGPDAKNERATGYGVALVLGLLQAPGLC